jgi:hypothetical protein
MTGKKALGKWIRLFFYPIRWWMIRFSPLTYLHWQYRFVTGNTLNLKEPTLYTEKLQFLRHVVFPRDPLVIRATDRVAVRDMLIEKGLKQYLIPSHGSYDRFQDIPWQRLPRQFVLKCTHASGFNQIILDKNKVHVPTLKRQFNRWLKQDYGLKTLQRHYSPIPRKILVEKYLGLATSLPTEYKIHVFHGQAKYLYVVTGRGADIRYTHLLINWTPFPGAQFQGSHAADYPVIEPEKFKTMIQLAEKLGSPFPFVRVDLYSIKGKIYFSALTFTPANGSLAIVDSKVDLLMGTWLSLDENETYQ